MVQWELNNFREADFVKVYVVWSDSDNRFVFFIAFLDDDLILDVGGFIGFAYRAGSETWDFRV